MIATLRAALAESMHLVACYADAFAEVQAWTDADSAPCPSAEAEYKALEAHLTSLHAARSALAKPDAESEVARLRKALEAARHETNSLRVWGGTEWTYHPPQAGRIARICTEGLAATPAAALAKPDEREHWRALVTRACADANRYGLEGLKMCCTPSETGQILTWEMVRPTAEGGAAVDAGT